MVAKEQFAEGLCVALGNRTASNSTNEYRSQWRQVLARFLTLNPRGTLPSRQPALANSLPPTFPSIELLNLYLNPVVSSDSDLDGIVIKSEPPNLTAIAHLCELFFPWGNQQQIISSLETTAIPALLIHTLTNEVVLRDTELSRTPSSAPDSKVSKAL